MKIKRLESSVASRIAAGEVVERPVSAVKEMIENSLDAGAHDIKITLAEGGKLSIVVEDDGCGIAFDDLPLAVERYATSKIATLDDLEHVSTLGYRGEALSSIAAVSRFEIRTRRAEDNDGSQIIVDAGEIKSHVRAPAMVGTRISAEDLFYNMPARKKFLKNGTAELKRIIQAAQDHAIAYPSVRFRVFNDGRAMLDIGRSASTDEVLASIWGDDNRAVRAVGESGSVSVVLWWNAMPGSRRLSLTTFVNARRVSDPTVRSAINATGSSAFGDWVVLISMPAEEVDVNIHPAKAEVRFRRSGPVFEAVRRAAERALLAGGGFAEDPIDGSIRDGFARSKIDPSSAPPSSGASFFTNVPPDVPDNTINNEANRTGGELFQPTTLHPARRYLGQAQGGYLVFDDPRGLCLVDAHAAHERILYEQIEDTYKNRSVDTQHLVSPQEIPSALVATIVLNRAELREMGFLFVLEGDPNFSSPVMVALPVLRGLARLSPIEMLRSAVKGIEEESDPSKRDREVWWRWARTACRDAIKLGRVFEETEALDLFDRLERCRSPYSCPHGRPTTIFLAGEKLKSWFER